MRQPVAAAGETVILHALNHGVWQEVQVCLKRTLEAHQLGDLVPPGTLILHELLDQALRAMHLRVFRNILESEAGLPFDAGDAQLEPLYKAELSEHGSQNIAHACAESGWQLNLRFPPAGPGETVLCEFDLPFVWARLPGQADKLVDALGFSLATRSNEKACRVELSKQAGAHAPEVRPPCLMSHAVETESLTRIFEQLGFGLIDFSSTGKITSASASMLARLRLEAQPESIAILNNAIPLGFHQDVIWGLALAGDNGAFENYRIRVQVPGVDSLSILFNVSGFRQGDGTVHSLWQVVSQAEGASQLSEGSIINEVRIHNITRNYVPQLVEKKARDAVRLGKSNLTNEERPMAVLFCDIVGFTSYVESNASSESVIDTLNSILRRISVSVRVNRGSIDKFMGDCIMALFEDPADAVLAALDMQDHSEDINSLRFRAGQQTLQLRIGIHWGDVVIGNVGTSERLDWTAIGDVVNTASRIEKGCQPGSTLISVEVRDAISKTYPGRFAFDAIFGLQVKGKRDDLKVCHVSLAAAGHGGSGGNSHNRS